MDRKEKARQIQAGERAFKPASRTGNTTREEELLGIGELPSAPAQDHAFEPRTTGLGGRKITAPMHDAFGVNPTSGCTGRRLIRFAGRNIFHLLVVCLSRDESRRPVNSLGDAGPLRTHLAVLPNPAETPHRPSLYEQGLVRHPNDEMPHAVFADSRGHGLLALSLEVHDQLFDVLHARVRNLAVDQLVHVSVRHIRRFRDCATIRRGL